MWLPQRIWIFNVAPLKSNYLMIVLTFVPACLDSLSFLEMDFRHQGIRKAYWNSCAWTFRHESYNKWMNEKRGLLWIKGKPGSGKSTLMKKILDSFDERKSQQQLRLYFFFHRRGNSLQYTQIGMFRTILHQLLGQIPTVRADFRRLWEGKARHGGGQTVEWNLEELRNIFSSSVLRAAEGTPIRISIDALDEAGEDYAQDLLSYVHELNEKIRVSEAYISICFSCRKYPFFARNGGLEICVDDENHKDIEEYLFTELRRLLDQETTSESVLHVLQADLAKKASGVFSWAYLMVPFVAKQYNDGEHLDSIRRKSDQVPSDLSHIYKHVLTEVVDVEKRPRTMHLLQWIFLAKWPLTVTELRHAMASDDSSVRPSQYSIEESKGFIDNDEQMRKSIISLSGGLAEIKKNVLRGRSGALETRFQVQFIHESMNDFLREDRFLCLGIPIRGNPIGQSHYELCMSCLNYMKLEEISTEKINFEKRFPLIKYVAHNWRRHAEEAEARGITLQGLLQRFEWPSQKLLQLWIDIFSTLEHGSYRGATLLHIAAASNLLSVIRALLKTKAEVDARDDEGATPLHYTTRFENQAVSNEASVLHLLENGADIEAHEPLFGTALSRAAMLHNERMVHLLVRKGADVNAIGGYWGTALEAAVEREKDNAAIVRFLLENGADADGRNGKEFSALQRAARRDKVAMMRLLVQGGASVNGPAGPYGTALEAAVTAKSEVAVRYLLEEAQTSLRKGEVA